MPEWCIHTELPCTQPFCRTGSILSLQTTAESVTSDDSSYVSTIEQKSFALSAQEHGGLCLLWLGDAHTFDAPSVATLLISLSA